jgi:hypothetical protein
MKFTIFLYEKHANVLCRVWHKNKKWDPFIADFVSRCGRMLSWLHQRRPKKTLDGELSRRE